MANRPTPSPSGSRKARPDVLACLCNEISKKKRLLQKGVVSATAPVHCCGMSWCLHSSIETCDGANGLHWSMSMASQT